MCLPSQHHPPGPDPIVWVVIPLGAKFDVLGSLVIRKDLLYTFIELLGKRCQALRGAELGTLELPWLPIG